MAGYLWDPVVRITPKNGADIVYWFSDQLTDLGGHTRIAVRYPEVKTDREDINRSLRPIVFGVRPEVDIDCTIFSMADQAFLATIQSALLSPADYDVFLSLDGGVVERQVVINRNNPPTPIAGKTVLGATVQLQVRCKDLIAQMPAMNTDPATGGEFVQNGSLDSWTSSTDCDSWTEVVGGTCTLTKDTLGARSGACALLSRVDSGSLWMQQTLPNSLRLGCWYRLDAYARFTAVPFNARIGLRNATRSLDVTSDGKTWGAFTQYAVDSTISTAATYFLEEVYIRASTAFAADDSYILFLYGSDVGSVLRYDDVSLYGPVLRPGYATW